MTVNDVLAGLFAGLEEDEAVARAAAPAPNTRWVRDSDGELYSVCSGLDDPSRCDQHEPGTPNLCDDIPIGPDSDFDPQGHIAAYMQRYEPARALRLVAKLREVLDEHRRTQYGHCEVCREYDFHRTYDPVPWPCPTVRALAGIYEPTTEGGPTDD